MSNKPTYETWPIDTINTVAWNPRVALRPTDPEWKQIAKSLEHFGLVVPLVVNRRTNNLISGHQRLAVLKHEGHTSVPVTVVDLDDDSEMQLNIAMNSIHGRWDEELLAGVLDYLADAGVAHLTGFTSEELARYTGQLAAEAAPKDLPIVAPTGDTELAPPVATDPDAPSFDTTTDEDDFSTVYCPNCATGQPA